jgi:hypothetical protein
MKLYKQKQDIFLSKPKNVKMISDMLILNINVSISNINSLYYVT